VRTPKVFSVGGRGRCFRRPTPPTPSSHVNVEQETLGLCGSSCPAPAPAASAVASLSLCSSLLVGACGHHGDSDDTDLREQWYLRRSGVIDGRSRTWSSRSQPLARRVCCGPTTLGWFYAHLAATLPRSHDGGELPGALAHETVETWTRACRCHAFARRRANGERAAW
jgi:hypothetical protein